MAHEKSLLVFGVLALAGAMAVAYYVWRQNAHSGSVVDDKQLAVKEYLVLDLPRNPAANEEVSVRIRVRSLPDDAKVVVRTRGGKICGTIFPFKMIESQTAGLYTVPVPESAIEDGKVVLRLEVVETGGNQARTPTASEIESVEVSLTPVTGDYPEKQ